MKDEPADLIKGTNKIQNRSKIALSKGTGKGIWYKVSGSASQRVQLSAVLKPILNNFLFVESIL